MIPKLFISLFYPLSFIVDKSWAKEKRVRRIKIALRSMIFHLPLPQILE